MMPREHEFRSEVFWAKEGEKENSMDFLYHFQDRGNVKASSAVPFRGNPDRICPEELFVTSVSSCQMLTYLHLCSKNGIEIISYRDEAKGFLSILPGEKIFIHKIHLFPVITFMDMEDDVHKALSVRLIQEAHELCFISNSIKTEILIEPNFLYKLYG